MKKTIFTLLLLAGANAAYAQGADPAAAAKPADAKKTTAQAKPAPAVKKSVRVETPKPAEQDAEESVVMIDSRSDQEENGRPSVREGEQDEPAVPGGMPSSYGQLKGVMTEAGRTLLVFESPDDGSISFVQVTAGKSGVAWKLVGRIPRSQD